MRGCRDSTCSPWTTPCQRRWRHLKEAVTLWEAHAAAGSWQDLRPHADRSPGWSRFAGRTCDPMGDPRWSSLVLKDCTPWEGPTLEQLVKNCSPWEGLMLEKLEEDCGRDPMQRKSVKSPPPEEEGVAETT